MVSCELCGKTFTSQRFLGNHLKTKHNQNTIEKSLLFRCGECETEFNRTCNLLRHLRDQHGSASSHRCFHCPKYFAFASSLEIHERTDHGMEEVPTVRNYSSNPVPVEFTATAISSRFQTHRLKLERGNDSLDPFNYLISQQPRIMDFIDDELRAVRNMKIGMSIAVKLVKPLTNDDVTAFFNSCFMRLSDHITNEEYLEHVDQLMSNLNVFASCGSGWVIESLCSVEIKTALCQKLSGASYIETPTPLKGLSRSLLNIKNKKDNFCFLYCVAAALFAFIGGPTHPKNHKPNIKYLKFNSKRMPMPLSSIPSFEKSNNVSINVYQLEQRKLLAVYYSKNKSSKRRINLLRLIEGSKTHYCLIKNFSNLLQRLTRSSKKQQRFQV